MIVSVPTYFLHALTQLQIKELPGDAANNPTIVAYWKEAGIELKVTSDETPWCAAFVGAMLMRGEVQSSNKANAKSYLQWGKEVIGLGLLGAIVVLNRARPAPEWQGHVGFCCGFDGSTIRLLGGNQGNKVSIASFPRARVAGIRYPAGWDVQQANFMLPVSAVDPTDR